MTADTDVSRRTSTAFAEIHKQCALKKSDSKTKLGHQNNGRNNLSGQVGCLSVSGDGKKNKKRRSATAHPAWSCEDTKPTRRPLTAANRAEIYLAANSLLQPG